MVGIFALDSQAAVSNKVIAGTIANSRFSQGNIKESGRAFDISIGGEGWIPLLDSDKKIVYTRNGSLGMSKDGFLTHLPSGLPIITINASGVPEKINLANSASKPFYGNHSGRRSTLTSMFFTEEGVLEGLYSDGQSAHITKLKLAAFENQRELKLLDAKTDLFEAPAAVGEVAYGDAETEIFGKIFARALEEIPADRYLPK